MCNGRFYDLVSTGGDDSIEEVSDHFWIVIVYFLQLFPSWVLTTH